MLLLALDIPEERRSVYAIVIEDLNLLRMKEGDPVTLESNQRGGLLPAPQYPQNFSLLIAYLNADGTREFHQLAEQRNPAALLAYLERGRQWRPEVDGVQHATSLKDLGKHKA